ncbi:unnamed protein product, partial [Amoebophrya sp. A25]|eukprot:GSA25T00026480001.1
MWPGPEQPRMDYRYNHVRQFEFSDSPPERAGPARSGHRGEDARLGQHLNEDRLQQQVERQPRTYHGGGPRRGSSRGRREGLPASSLLRDTKSSSLHAQRFASASQYPRADLHLGRGPREEQEAALLARYHAQQHDRFSSRETRERERSGRGSSPSLNADLGEKNPLLAAEENGSKQGPRGGGGPLVPPGYVLLPNGLLTKASGASMLAGDRGAMSSGMRSRSRSLKRSTEEKVTTVELDKLRSMLRDHYGEINRDGGRLEALLGSSGSSRGPGGRATSFAPHRSGRVLDHELQQLLRGAGDEVSARRRRKDHDLLQRDATTFPPSSTIGSSCTTFPANTRGMSVQPALQRGGVLDHFDAQNEGRLLYSERSAVNQRGRRDVMIDQRFDVKHHVGIERSESDVHRGGTTGGKNISPSSTDARAPGIIYNPNSSSTRSSPISRRPVDRIVQEDRDRPRDLTRGLDPTKAALFAREQLLEAQHLRTAATSSATTGTTGSRTIGVSTTQDQEPLMSKRQPPGRRRQQSTTSQNDGAAQKQDAKTSTSALNALLREQADDVRLRHEANANEAKQAQPERRGAPEAPANSQLEPSLKRRARNEIHVPLLSEGVVEDGCIVNYKMKNKLQVLQDRLQQIVPVHLDQENDGTTSSGGTHKSNLKRNRVYNTSNTNTSSTSDTTTGTPNLPSPSCTSMILDHDATSSRSSPNLLDEGAPRPRSTTRPRSTVLTKKRMKKVNNRSPTSSVDDHVVLEMSKNSTSGTCKKPTSTTGGSMKPPAAIISSATSTRVSSTSLISRNKNYTDIHRRGPMSGVVRPRPSPRRGIGITKATLKGCTSSSASSSDEGDSESDGKPRPYTYKGKGKKGNLPTKQPPADHDGAKSTADAVPGTKESTPTAGAKASDAPSRIDPEDRNAGAQTRVLAQNERGSELHSVDQDKKSDDQQNKMVVGSPNAKEKETDSACSHARMMNARTGCTPKSTNKNLKLEDMQEITSTEVVSAQKESSMMLNTASPKDEEKHQEDVENNKDVVSPLDEGKNRPRRRRTSSEDDGNSEDEDQAQKWEDLLSAPSVPGPRKSKNPASGVVDVPTARMIEPCSSTTASINTAPSTTIKSWGRPHQIQISRAAATSQPGSSSGGQVSCSTIAASSSAGVEMGRLPED